MKKKFYQALFSLMFKQCSQWLLFSFLKLQFTHIIIAYLQSLITNTLCDTNKKKHHAIKVLTLKKLHRRQETNKRALRILKRSMRKNYQITGWWHPGYQQNKVHAQANSCKDLPENLLAKLCLYCSYFQRYRVNSLLEDETGLETARLLT